MAVQHKANTGGQGGALDGGRELSVIDQKDWQIGSLFKRIIDHVNGLGQSLQASGNGEVPAPKAPDSVSVKVSGELMHVQINHTGELNRNTHYFTEIGVNDNGAFSQPVVVFHGPSRTSHPIFLPTFVDGGVTKNNYYVRVYAQTAGGPPSPVTIAGGATNPTKFQMAGSTNMTLLSSTGSGTAANTGQQGGWGFGKVQKRPS